jgi:hypothetical protein
VLRSLLLATENHSLHFFLDSMFIAKRLAWQQMAYLLLSVALATPLFAAPPSSVLEGSEMELSICLLSHAVLQCYLLLLLPNRLLMRLFRQGGRRPSLSFQCDLTV